MPELENRQTLLAKPPDFEATDYIYSLMWET